MFQDLRRRHGTGAVLRRTAGFDQPCLGRRLARLSGMLLLRILVTRTAGNCLQVLRVFHQEVQAMSQEFTRLLRTRSGGWIGPQELHEVLAEEGYSGAERENFLNSVLTELAADSSGHGVSDDSGAALLAEVRAILEKEQAKYGQRPIAEDLS